MALIARFVDSIAATATVRLDVNDGDLWRLQEPSRFDPPRAKRARVSTLLVDGAQYPATAYDDRTLELRLLLEAETSDVVAGEVQKLARELDRLANFFEYRPDGASASVFFRTHRLGLDAVGMPTDGTRLLLEVNVPAEPFAFGLPVTLPAVTVNNDPAAATNPMRFDVSDVQGDVEAETKVAESGLAWFNSTVVFATRRRGDPAAVPFLKQAEAMTQGTDTTTQPNDAVMSGSGNNYSRCTFANTAMVERLSFAFPLAASADARGEYRIYGRMRHSVAGDVIDVKVGISPPGIGSIQYSSTVRLENTANTRVYDFGLFPVPFGIDPIYDGPSGQMLSVAQYDIEIHAQRVSGTGTLDFDYFLAVPADDQFAAIEFGNDSAGTGYVLDSYNDMVYAVNGSAVDHSADIKIAGMLPRLLPGVTNRIYVISGLNVAGTAAPVTATSVLTVTYWPRFLHVRSP